MTCPESVLHQHRVRQKGYQEEIRGLVHDKDIDEAAIDYAGFLRLTTFGPGHLGEGAMYSLRLDGSQVVGVRSGLGTALTRGIFEDIEMQAMADHQRDAVLDFPTTVRDLLSWIFKQVGDVELAIEGSEQYPVAPYDWVQAAVSEVVLEDDIAVPHQAQASIQKIGGLKRNEANAAVRAQILNAYRSGGYVSKNAATAELAERFNRSRSTVRKILIRV